MSPGKTLNGVLAFNSPAWKANPRRESAMRYINYVLIALASSLLASHAVLWLTKPSPLETTTIPPMMFNQDQGELIVWGGWQTVEGYQAPGTNAVEIHCNRERGVCIEAVATIFHHSTGEDLEAQVFHYRVAHWDDVSLEAVAEGAMAGCLDRRLAVALSEKMAGLSWAPPSGCEGYRGRAVLVGDPL